jgi:hypothetical protein
MNSTYFLSLGSDAVVTLYCNYKTHPDILRFASGMKPFSKYFSPGGGGGGCLILLSFAIDAHR